MKLGLDNNRDLKSTVDGRRCYFILFCFSYFYEFKVSKFQIETSEMYAFVGVVFKASPELSLRSESISHITQPRMFVLYCSNNNLCNLQYYKIEVNTKM